ncbi:MAG: hypothetical protein JSS09_08130 [Verrucomicrobia bacterium]|nr:hypothetical protein [Verrucomicrobiota bacterium]
MRPKKELVRRKIELKSLALKKRVLSIEEQIELDEIESMIIYFSELSFKGMYSRAKKAGIKLRD